MASNEYLDSLMAELASQGIEPPKKSNTSVINNINDRELQIIMDMERVTGKKYSDEQRKILEHHGNAAILACAGSGKTTVSTHLIAKRILTGEIKDVNKLIYTTYSKAGATEMKERLDILLRQLGVNLNVQVRTLHSFFLQVLRTFGVTANIIDGSERSKMIRQACKDAEFPLKDDDLMLIDNLLSYQVNCLLSDKKTIDSYVNTLEDLTLEQYSKIRKSYAYQKGAKSVIDYDDMQSYLYLWLVKYAKSKNQAERDIAKSVRDYCKAMYTDFYIDEAQDVSKIQFAIVRAMTADPNDLSKLDRNLVFIGDDDQCIAEGTKIRTSNGIKNIEDIKVGDEVETVFTTDKHEYNVGFSSVNAVSCKTITGKIVQLTLSDGTILRGTEEHVCFIKDIHSLYTKHIGDNCRKELDNEHDSLSEFYGSGIIKYYMLEMGKIKKNMYVPVIVDKDVIDLCVDKVELIDYTGKVYDLSVPKTRNFVVNNVVVHNCIYQWRGGDPSIILSVGPTFNMPTFVLSTNYRCLNEIVDYATVGIKCNNSRYNKGMSAFNQGGSVKILPSEKEDLCSLSILAMNHIKWWLKQGHSLSDIAVLSRNNFHLALLSNMLLREGIYCNMTEDMKLTKSYMYQDVKDIISISEPTWKKELTAKVLWRLCRYMGAANARVIADFQDNSGLSFEDAIGWLIKHFVDNTVEFNKPINIALQAEEKLRYYMLKLSNETKSDMLTIYKALTCGDRDETVRTLLFQYLSASSFMYKSKDKNRSIVGLVQYIINLMKKDGFDKMMDFLRVTEQLEGGKMVIPGEKMTLTTIHSAKGREWKDVIMFACDNVSQPSFDGIHNMIEDGISVHDIFENLDEERRLFYVGNTRAKENLLVLTYGAPSIFILEALGLFKDKTGGNNDTILELVDSQDVATRYRDFIQSNILDINSKYYYNSKDYTV